MAQLDRTESAEFLSDDDIALVTATEAGDRLGVDPALVRQWKRRELLQVQSWKGNQPLFSLREVVELEHYLRTTGRGFRRDA